MSLRKTRFHCLNCNSEIHLDMKEYETWQMMTCPRCDETFNICGVYYKFYEEIPLCKKIIDITTSYICTNYSIEGDDEKVARIENFLVQNNFNRTLPNLIFDTVLYGDSFFEIINESGNTHIEKLNPISLEYETDWRREPPAIAMYPYVEKIIEHSDEPRDINPENFIHFVGERSISGPWGFSVCGFWFNSWYILRDIPRALVNMAYQGVNVEPWQKFAELIESGVIAGSGVPYHLIYPSRSSIDRFVQMMMTHFDNRIKRRRQSISSVVERRLFPLILSEAYDRETSPKFIFS